MDFVQHAAGLQVAGQSLPLGTVGFTLDRGEMHCGLPVARGRLTKVYSTWFDSPDDPEHEHREAALLIECEACDGLHHHGWVLGQPYSYLSFRATSCPIYGSTGYYVGVLPRGAGHCVPPDMAIRREIRRRRRGGAR